jgi:hypothetical protein
MLRASAGIPDEGIHIHPCLMKCTVNIRHCKQMRIWEKQLGITYTEEDSLLK